MEVPHVIIVSTAVDKRYRTYLLHARRETLGLLALRLSCGAPKKESGFALDTFMVTRASHRQKEGDTCET